MEITAGLLAKVGLGLGAAGAGITCVYFGSDYLNNSLSDYDRALINFLNKDTKHDIKFEVKKGDETLNESHLTLSGNDGQTVSISAKVQVSNGATTDALKKDGSSAFDREEIKQLNKGQDWTWKCTFEFKKEDTTNDRNIKTEYSKAQIKVCLEYCNKNFIVTTKEVAKNWKKRI